MLEADELSDRVAFLSEGKLFAVDTPDNLKMKYGKRSVKVRLRSGSNVRIELAAADAGDRIKELVNSRNVMTIHTEEATLEDIFIEITGRGLSV